MVTGQKAATTGLGKGLAGILGDMVDVAPTEGVNELLGSQEVRRSAAVREMVTEMAISAIASGFATDGVIIARRDGDGQLATVASKVPSSWSGLDPLMFEVSGQLWRMLHSGTDGQIQDDVGSYHFLLCRQSSQDGPMAAAIIRKRPFDDHEVLTVGRLVRSVGSALGESLLIPPDSAIRVLSQESNDGVLADVRLGLADDRRHGAAVAESAPIAIARAAAEICDIDLEIQFVGQSTVDESLVTMVVVSAHSGGPLFGLAVTDPSASTGPAEAVFSAARIVNGDPFSAHNAAAGQ